MAVSKEDKFDLEKSIWTHDDFETMGWHDSVIYSMCFEKDEHAWTSDLILDIDYIFKWVQPDKDSESFTFWVAPCTLVFKEVFGLKINLDMGDYSIEGLEISDLNLVRKEKRGTVDRFHWVIELNHGNIEFESDGLKQFVRQKPIHISGQQLTLKERGGISFAKKEVEI
jgi:hypothetical protein